MGNALAVSIDGTRSAPERARISVLDDGLLRGDGVFEAIKLYRGHPFRLEQHLQRLAGSAAAIELAFEPRALRAEIEALLAGIDREAMLRIVLTRGGRRILLVEELPGWPASARIALLTLTPNEILLGVKSISYAANMQATRIARARGADEAVYVRPDGIVLEAPTSSIFWAGGDGRLRTPALGTGILDSITRRVVLEALEVEEGAFDATELGVAREAFLASTTREIQPIAAIDGRALPEPAGGEAARRASRTLVEAVERERAGQ